MSSRRIYDRERHAQFITFSCYHRRRLLDDHRAKRIVVGTLNAQLRRLTGHCVGYVVMPDHVHAIVWLAEAGQLSELMKQWKRMSSYHIRRYFVSSFPAYASRMEVNSVWQARYYAFSLYSHRMLEQKLNYMHQNPVRAGLVEQAVDWRWSSARYYSRGASAEIPVGWLED